MHIFPSQSTIYTQYHAKHEAVLKLEASLLVQKTAETTKKPLQLAALVDCTMHICHIISFISNTFWRRFKHRQCYVEVVLQKEILFLGQKRYKYQIGSAVSLICILGCLIYKWEALYASEFQIKIYLCTLNRLCTTIGFNCCSLGNVCTVKAEMINCDGGNLSQCMLINSLVQSSEAGYLKKN